MAARGAVRRRAGRGGPARPARRQVAQVASACRRLGYELVDKYWRSLRLGLRVTRGPEHQQVVQAAFLSALRFARSMETEEESSAAEVVLLEQPVQVVRVRCAGCCLRRPRRRVLCCLLVVSALVNFALGLALWVLESSEDDRPPPPPPPPANASFHTCPFAADALGGPVVPNASVVGVGSTFVELCWSDYARLDRGAAVAAYNVDVSDPWITGGAGGTWVHAYAGRATHVNITDLLPDTRYSMRVRGSSATSANVTVTAKTEPRGWCGNAADVEAQRRTKSSMKHDIQSCMIKGIVSGDDAIRRCVCDVVGLSSGCAACWVAEAHCTIKHCFAPCTSPSSQACQDCSERACFPDVVTCSGSTFSPIACPWQLPDLLCSFSLLAPYLDSKCRAGPFRTKDRQLSLQASSETTRIDLSALARSAVLLEKALAAHTYELPTDLNHPGIGSRPQ
jgi:hypothetical protein